MKPVGHTRLKPRAFFTPTNAPSRSHAGTIVGFCPPSTLTTTEVKAPNGKTHKVQSPDKPITHILVKINTPSSFTLHGLPECVYPVPLKSYNSHVRGHDGKLSISQFPIRYFTPQHHVLCITHFPRPTPKSNTSFNLRPLYACTAYKVQGRSLKSILIGSIPATRNYLYGASIPTPPRANAISSMCV